MNVPFVRDRKTGLRVYVTPAIEWTKADLLRALAAHHAIIGDDVLRDLVRASIDGGKIVKPSQVDEAYAVAHKARLT